MHQSLIRAALVGLGLVLLAGCAGTWAPSLDEAGLPRRVELASVPFFPQQEYRCGPAALATVLVQRGVETTPEALVGRVYLPGRQGSLQVEMVAAARAHGLLVYPLEPRLEDVIREVAAGNPVLVLQNLAFERWPQWHFAVVVGYDLDRQRLILRSGTEARREESLAAFSRSWVKGGRWAVVTVEPTVFPATASLNPWLLAASDLEQTGQAAVAEQAYLVASSRWESGVPWFALANSRYRGGQLGEAEQALRRSIASDGAFAPAWANLGHVLALRGCTDFAGQSQTCARRLAPGDGRLARPLPKAERASAAVCAPPPRCPR